MSSSAAIGVRGVCRAAARQYYQGEQGDRSGVREIFCKGEVPMDSTAVGQRQTTQRRAILKVIREARGPLTVERIHKQAKRANRNLGIATVSRTVKLLLQSRQIKPITLPDGETRYEPTDLGHHCYFYCRQCKQVYDLPMCAVSVSDGATLPEGYRVDGHSLTLHGSCPKCSRAAKKR